MKDYYRILGIRETASDEEIRQHWVELMRKYHPDNPGDEGVNEERVKEINEAYEILKYSSSRAKYDFERAYERRKRRSSLGRTVFRKAYLLLIPLLLGLIYLSIQIAWPPSPPDAPSNRQPVSPFPSVSPEEESLRFKNWQGPFLNISAAQEFPDRTQTEPREPPQNAPKGSIKEATKGALKGSPKEPLKEFSKGSPKEPFDTLLKSPVEEKRQEQADTKEKEARDEDKIEEMLQWSDGSNLQHPASSPMAVEEEIKSFFEDYVKRYMQRDITGFLKFFSLNAIQNGKDDFKEIRRIYTDFFDQSQSLFYQLKNPKIAISLSHALVKASYEIRQIRNNGDIKLWKGNIEWALVREDGDLKIFTLQYQHDRSP